MPKIAALVLLATLLSACGTAPSKLAGSACPSLPVYSPEFTGQAADELDALPDGAALGVLVTDYGRMREGVRACLKAAK